MTLEEAIKHCHEKAKELTEKAKLMREGSKNGLFYPKDFEDCEACASEHEQLAGWLTELQERRAADRWIPVCERLPDKNGRCLVTTDFGDVCMDSFVDGIFVLYLGNVIAWKPLPEPYTESEADND